MAPALLCVESMSNRASLADTANLRTDRLILLLLVLNVIMVLVGVFGVAWEASRAAARPLVPTNLADTMSSPRWAGTGAGPYTLHD